MENNGVDTSIFDGCGTGGADAGARERTFAVRELYDDARLAGLLPYPKADANKYTRGTLTLLAGSGAYPGAACLAAAAGQRTGASYTQVFTAPENVRTVQAFRPSLVVRSWTSLEAGALRASETSRPCAYVVGPGFDAADEEAAELLFLVLDYAQAPVLVDGGAFSALANERGLKVLRRRFLRGLPTVLTPHGGEAARLAAAFGVNSAAPEADRGQEAFALDLAGACGGTVILKGPDTCIAQAAGLSGGEHGAHGAHGGSSPRFFMMREGTPALAKAGTGDVLAGVIGALLAQGLSPFDASVLGSVLHARAARAVESRLGSICVVPEDVVDALPEAVGNLPARL